MEELELKSTIMSCQMDELSDAERHLVELAIEAIHISMSVQPCCLPMVRRSLVAIRKMQPIHRGFALSVPLCLLLVPSIQMCL